MSAGWNATQRELEILELRAENERLRKALTELIEVSPAGSETPKWRERESVVSRARAVLSAMSLQDRGRS